MVRLISDEKFVVLCHLAGGPRRSVDLMADCDYSATKSSWYRLIRQCVQLGWIVRTQRKLALTEAGQNAIEAKAALLRCHIKHRRQSPAA